LLAEVIIL